MKPHQKVRKDIEALYLQISEIQLGAICIYPELQRDLDKVQGLVTKLYDRTLTIQPAVTQAEAR